MKTTYSGSEASCMYNRGEGCIKSATATFNSALFHSIKSILLKLMLVVGMMVCCGNLVWGQIDVLNREWTGVSNGSGYNNWESTSRDNAYSQR